MLDGSVVAVVEEASPDEGGGAHITTVDPDLPLLPGDTVAFLSTGEHC